MSQIEGESCPKCEEKITKEKDGVCCDGSCGQAFHTKCVQLQVKEVEIIKKNDNVQFICDVCQAFCLKTINNKLNSIYDYLYKLDSRTAETLKLVTEKNESSGASDVYYDATQKSTVSGKEREQNARQQTERKKNTNEAITEREKRLAARNKNQTQKSNEPETAAENTPTQASNVHAATTANAENINTQQSSGNKKEAVNKNKEKMVE